MLKPDKAILKQIKAYDKRLDVRWNNRDTYWEVWYKTSWGNKLITPIVENIYKEGGSPVGFYPLDTKIIDWLYFSDTQRSSKRWKWISRKKFNEKKHNQKMKSLSLFENIAKDNYNLINMELLNPYLEKSDYIAPDVYSNTGRRTMARSAANAKEYFDDTNRIRRCR